MKIIQKNTMTKTRILPNQSEHAGANKRKIKIQNKTRTKQKATNIIPAHT